MNGEETARRRRPPLSVSTSGRSASEQAGEPASATASAHEAYDNNTSSSSTNSGTLDEGLQLYGRSRRSGDPNTRAMLAMLPSSAKELARLLERKCDEVRLLQERNVQLQAREVEVSSLTLRLQQQFTSTRAQVDSIKAQIQLHLANPVSDEEYAKIEAMPEGERDLLDTIKLGVYRRLGSMRASADAATRRAAELASTVGTLTEENRDLKLEVAELRATNEKTSESRGEQARRADAQAARIVELEAAAKDYEGRLRTAFLDQEQFMTAKLTAQMKTDETARLLVRLDEAEKDTQRYRANAECNEQKLDILKSEYYELKLTYSKRVLELESCLKAADEKLKTLGDVELESELFISTLAERQRAGDLDEGLYADSETLALVSAHGGRRNDGGPASDVWAAIPRSRKDSYALKMASRCLRLENKVQLLAGDVQLKSKQIERLQVSLEGARSALNNVNSPYTMVEKTLDELSSENERMRERIGVLQEENKELQEQLTARTNDVHALCRHRQELLRVRRLLHKLGIAEGYVFNDTATDLVRSPVAAAAAAEGHASPGARSGRKTTFVLDGDTRPSGQSSMQSAGAAKSQPSSAENSASDTASRGGSALSRVPVMDAIQISS